MHTVLRGLAFTISTLIILMFTAFGVSYWYTVYRLNKTYSFAGSNLKIPVDSLSIIHGRHLSDAITKCPDCHGSDLGGKVFIDDPALGIFAGPNITGGAGSVVKKYSDSDWDRAIRHGVNRKGHPLIFMPSNEYAHLSNKDISDLTAYLKQIPPVNRSVPKSKIRYLGRALYTVGKLPLLHAESIAHTSVGKTKVDTSNLVSYGRYIAMTGGCISCHGSTLAGGRVPGTPPDFPPAANLTMDPVYGIGKWNYEDFSKALRTGIRPDGSNIDRFMPWPATSKMTDHEMQSIWAYVKQLTPQK